MKFEFLMYVLFILLFLSTSLTITWYQRKKQIKDILKMYKNLDKAQKELGIGF